MLRVAVATLFLATLALAYASLRPTQASGGTTQPPAGAAESAPPAERGAPEGLAALFAAADRSADGLPALITEASARLVSGGADDDLALRLEPYCRRAFFGAERFAGMERLGLGLHTVQRGELPGAIARRYGFSHGLLGRLNEGYAPESLPAGWTLKVHDLRRSELQLVVDRERHRLAAWRRAPGGGGWLLVMYVTVGLGAPETPTPSGSTRVVERALDCAWTDPNTGVTYPPGDPGNVLGGYWMRLDEAGIGESGIGLHGFTGDDPSAWLGQDASNGCVRMLQDDIDRVFHLALVGTPLRFVP